MLNVFLRSILIVFIKLDFIVMFLSIQENVVFDLLFDQIFKLFEFSFVHVFPFVVGIRVLVEIEIFYICLYRLDCL